ncbi:Fic/DOC family N-terminal domain-containing protein [Clostridium chromiireducens]
MRIDGTQVTLDDMLEYGADENKKNIDIEEVLNYSTALIKGETLLKSIPIYTRLIKEMHKIL